MNQGCELVPSWCRKERHRYGKGKSSQIVGSLFRYLNTKDNTSLNAQLLPVDSPVMVPIGSVHTSVEQSTDTEARI